MDCTQELKLQTEIFSFRAAFGAVVLWSTGRKAPTKKAPSTVREALAGRCVHCGRASCAACAGPCPLLEVPEADRTKDERRMVRKTADEVARVRDAASNFKP